MPVTQAVDLNITPSSLANAADHRLNEEERVDLLDSALGDDLAIFNRSSKKLTYLLPCTTPRDIEAMRFKLRDLCFSSVINPRRFSSRQSVVNYSFLQSFYDLARYTVKETNTSLSRSILRSRRRLRVDKRTFMASVKGRLSLLYGKEVITGLDIADLMVNTSLDLRRNMVPAASLVQQVADLNISDGSGSVEGPRLEQRGASTSSRDCTIS